MCGDSGGGVSTRQIKKTGVNKGDEPLNCLSAGSTQPRSQHGTDEKCRRRGALPMGNVVVVGDLTRVRGLFGSCVGVLLLLSMCVDVDGVGGRVAKKSYSGTNLAVTTWTIDVKAEKKSAS